jgi:putative ABC transport system ATP-binding protein
MQEAFNISFVFSSHDHNLISAADDLIVLRDGLIQTIKRKAIDPAAPAADGVGTVARGVA